MEKIFENKSSTTNLFKRIKSNIIFQILHYTDFFTIVDLYFVNKQFREMAYKKYHKKIQMIITSIKNYKSEIKIYTNEDFRIILRHNSMQIRKEIKPLIMNILSDYYHKIPVLKYYLNKMKNRNISSINLEGTDIAKKSLKYLSYYISNNLIVEKINLSSNKLTGSVLVPLIETVGSAKNFKSLKLNNCIVDNSAMINLNNILKNCNSLESISMQNCNIDDNMISLVCSPHIKVLDLYGNNLNSEGVFHICKNFKFLKKLNLGKNNLDFNSALYLAVYIKSSESGLESLNLEQNYISSTGMNFLLQACLSSKNKSLKEIDLGHNICQNISKLPKPTALSPLQTLKLSANKFSLDEYQKIYKILKEYKQFLQIEYMDLSENILSEKTLMLILDIISECSIRKISFKSCYIIKTDFLNILLDYSIQNKCYLTYLDLSMNYLGLGNFKCLSEIINLNQLISLNISHNDLNLSEDTFSSLCDCMKSNTSLQELNLSNNFIGTKVTVLFDSISLNNNSQLKELVLDNNNINSYETFYHISQCFQNMKLSKLSLRRNEIKDYDISPVTDIFKNCIKVALTLDLRENKFTILTLIKFLEVLESNNDIDFSNIKLLIKLKSKSLSESYQKEKNVLLAQKHLNKETTKLLSKFFKF